MTAIEAVIFDWGGTLTPFASIEMEDMWRLAARHLAPHMPEDEEALTRRLMSVERTFWDRTAADARSGSLGDLLAQATATLGVDVAEAVIEEAGVRYLDAWTPHITHDPEAAATIRALRARGLRIGLLSNTHWPRAYHEHFLERDGLAELIDHRFYTSEMSHMKPHPAAFGPVLEALAITDPSRAVFVGDRPFDDIFGARRSGLRAVLRPNGDVPPYDVEPDATIQRLPELLALVDGWRASAG
ncbi:MAG: HAD family hydrolase [Chloroflexi bacterium]|nr:HAD family hydrolase [Chloroflexota bacterium]MDA1002662.1 HAD family hydrolase [Chloroflexota bacterium]